MKKWIWTQRITAAIYIVIVIAWFFPLQKGSVFAALLTILAGIWTAAERMMQLANRKLELQLEREQFAGQFVGTMNHYRHDWLNELQIISAYASLKKYEKILDYMETIKQKAVQESQLSKIGFPLLVSYLYMLKALYRSLAVEIEIDEAQDLNVDKLKIDTDAVIGALKRFTSRFAEWSDSEEEPVKLHVHVYKEFNQLYFVFLYMGIVQETELTREIDQAAKAYAPFGVQCEKGSCIQQKTEVIVKIQIEDNSEVKICS